MLSVVIITRNEAHIIGNTLVSLQGLTDDLVIVDNGSTDDTIAICKKFGARVIETTWAGYGATKNVGVEAAKHDWILSLDADEAIDAELKNELLKLKPSADNIVYKLSYKNFFCNKEIRFGVWAKDKHIRVFNRKKITWDTSEVHENLILPADVKVASLNGYILHYTVNNVEEFSRKTILYAKSNAKKYFLQGKKASFLKLYFAPTFNFLQHYIFRLGFLDGWEGYLICKTNAWYTFLKYVYLHEMNKNKSNAV
jgi:glycosyltransferase involved in cell wall biosynthesis